MADMGCLELVRKNIILNHLPLINIVPGQSHLLQSVAQEFAGESSQYFSD